MAQATTSGGSVDSCFTCSKKHSRIRPALCQCKHCSNSFCFDCMKEHHDDLHQNIGHASNQFNELTSLIKDKRKLVTEETIKSKTQMSEWLRKYISNLTAEKEKIDRDIEKAEQDAQKFVHDIEVQLQTLSPDIQSLTKSNIYSEEQMKKLLKTLEELIHQISSLTVRREYDLPSTVPKYKIGFDCSSKSTAADIPQTSKPVEEPEVEELEDEEQCRSNSPVADIQWDHDSDESSDIALPDEDYFCNREKHEPTSFTVNCMASDGINVMYSTIEDPQQERIAYCYLDDADVNYRQADPSRLWNQSRIVDMIWWDLINNFICATGNGIYRVEYLDEKFRIINAVKIRLSQVRVAANTDDLWIYGLGKFMIYNRDFEFVRLINFKLPRPLTLASFCLTDDTVAAAVIRRVENDRDILQIEFHDCDMQRRKRVRLGLSETSCAIRTDGNNQFYVAQGQRRFFIVSSSGSKQSVNLGKQAGCLAVVNSRNIVLTKSRSDLELVRC